MTPHRHLVICASTMDEARQWAEGGAPHLACVTASEQTAGRGRQGKIWKTFPGHSLAGTWVLRQGLGPHLPLVTSLAIQQMLEEESFATRIKWPNDILLNDQKVAGILVESTPAFALVGIGLNLTSPPDVPADFPGTFLATQGTPPNAQNVQKRLTACLQSLLALYESHGWGALHAQYTQKCSTLGQRVTWMRSNGHHLFGTATGLNAQGALELTDETGATHLIQSGEIIAQSEKPSV